MFFELHEQEVVPQLGLGDRGRIAANVLMDEPELAIVRVAGSIGIVAQSQMLGQPRHGWIRMLIVDRVGKVSRGSSDRFQRLVGPRSGLGGLIVLVVCVR